METKQTYLAIVCIGFLSVCILGTYLFTQDRQIVVQTNGSQQNTVTVSGSADRLVAPDTARVTFVVNKKDTELSRATDSVNTRISEAVQSLTEFGIEEKDIATKAYNVYPEYDYRRETGDRVFSGYQVSQEIELTIRNLDKVSDILASVAQLQVDNVSNLTFFVDQDTEIREELRNQAIKQAQGKAARLSDVLGVRLQTIVGFNEHNNDYYPSPVSTRLFAESSAETKIQATIPAGENNYSAEVSISYIIE